MRKEILEAKMRPSTIAAIWLVGGLLAVLAYAVGPDRFVDVTWRLLWEFQAGLARFVENLALVSFDLIRAAAIGLFVTFVLLAAMAIRRGLRARMALVVVSICYLGAVGTSPYDTSRGGWFMAFLLALVGAAIMTGRLMRSDRAVTRP